MSGNTKCTPVFVFNLYFCNVSLDFIFSSAMYILVRLDQSLFLHFFLDYFYDVL